MLPLANGNRRTDGLKTVIHVHLLTVLGVLCLVHYHYYYYYYCVLFFSVHLKCMVCCLHVWCAVTFH